MKKFFLIVFIAILSSSNNVSAQTSSVPDTLVYLQNIVANKAQYIGQPFSTLLNSLQIQIKYFSPYAGIHHDISKETSTSFAFYFPQNSEQIYLTYPSIVIYWQPYLNFQVSLGLFNQYHGGWTLPIISNYSNGIIKDIRVIE